MRYSHLRLFEGADLTTRRLAFIEARSDREGPVVWLTAGIHGDELGGIVVVQELFRRLRRQPLLAGRIAAFPLLNPFGLEAASRHIPSTQEDLNRSFPGNPAGTFAERIADLVTSRIRGDSPALVLDLHNDWIRSVPYALIDPRPASESGREAHRRVRELAQVTGFPIVDEQEEGVSRSLLRSTLSGSLLEIGVAALTLELGAAQYVEEGSVVEGLAAVWRVLASLGMVEAEHESAGASARAPKDYAGKLLRYSHEPSPSCAGIVRFGISPGETVEAGRALATLYDVFGRTLEVLRAEGPALVLGHADSSLAMPGVPLVALAMRRTRKGISSTSSG